MSESVDQFCDTFHDRLKVIEDRVSYFRAKIERNRVATKATIDREVDEAKAALARIKDDADAAGARMKVQEKTAAAEETIAEWKHDRELDKLERRAEDAETYAAWSLMVATKAIDEADLAAMQAIAARLDVEMAAATTD